MLLKPPTAVRFCARIATRAVAFAIVMGMPMKVRIGTVKSEPPPPTVFKKADPNPSSIINGI